MQILENLENISRIIEKYERLHEVGLITEVSTDDISGLDSSLAELDKQVDSLQAAIDTYIKIFDGLAGEQGGNGGVDGSPKAAAKECSDTLKKVRDQLDDIAQLDMGKMNAIGDFFGKDSSYKSALEELGQISAEMGKIHSIAAGAAAAIARLGKRSKGASITDDAVAGKGLMDANGFFKQGKIEFKDILKQVERTAKDNLPGAMGKLGGFLKGMVKGAKAKPLFGLSAEVITKAMANVKAEFFEPVGGKIVALGNDISKFGETMAKYKAKEKELKKAKRKSDKEEEANMKKAAALDAVELVGRSGEKKTFKDRMAAAVSKIDGDENQERVKMAMAGVAADGGFDDLKVEGLNRYKMDFLLTEEENPDDAEPDETTDDAPDETTDDAPDETTDEPDESTDPAPEESDEISTETFDAIEDKIVDELIDLVDDIEEKKAVEISDAMLEGKNRVNHNKEFYRMQKLAGIKR